VASLSADFADGRRVRSGYGLGAGLESFFGQARLWVAGYAVVLGDEGGLAGSFGEHDRKVVSVISGADDYKHGIFAG
jgi:hypothetical protein